MRIRNRFREIGSVNVAFQKKKVKMFFKHVSRFSIQDNLLGWQFIHRVQVSFWLSLIVAKLNLNLNQQETPGP